MLDSKVVTGSDHDTVGSSAPRSEIGVSADTQLGSAYALAIP